MKINLCQLETLTALVREQSRYDRTVDIHANDDGNGNIRFRVVDSDTEETVLKGNMDETGDFR